MRTERFMLANADCLRVLRAMPSNSIHAIVTDPPYGLHFMGKTWDKFGGPLGVGHGKARKGNYEVGGAMKAGSYDFSRNFEYQEWIYELGKLLLRVLKPGGYILIFGGTRLYHHVTCGLERAGFEIRDCLSWLYGSGFPKSLDVSKAIDKQMGAEREIVGTLNGSGYTKMNVKQGSQNRNSWDWNKFSDKPSSDQAKQWQGWGTALKPAWEPIILARKPLSEKTVVSNVLRHRTGAINIDGGRIKTKDGVPKFNNHAKNHVTTYADGLAGSNRTGEIDYTTGRFPANLLLSHSPDCVLVGQRKVGNGKFSKSGFRKLRDNPVYGKPNQTRIAPDNYGSETIEKWDCADDCPVAMLDRQSGQGKSSKTVKYRVPTTFTRDYQANQGYRPVGDSYKGEKSDLMGKDYPGFGDQGGASRFFYVAKAGRRERNLGLDGFELKKRPDVFDDDSYDWNKNKGPQYRKIAQPTQNNHPTVKPLKLMRYLVKLITPPKGIILDPLMGSGTTGMAAIYEGFKFIGIEKEPDYYKIAKARIRYAEKGE